MAAVPQPRLTPEEYVAQERHADTKSEYVEGVAYAMTGASREHGLIAFNLATELGRQLESTPCEAYVSEMRVRVDLQAYFYPDLVVVCDPPRFDDIQLDTLLNPTLVIEVLSPSTADYDQGRKFARYRSVASLRQYLLVAQDRCHVMLYTRQPNNLWLLSETHDLDSVVRLTSIGCELSVRRIYARVSFEDQAS